LKLAELRLTKRCPPLLNGLTRRLLRRLSTPDAALGKDQERGTRIDRMRLPGDVSAFFEMSHELGGRLLSYAQVLSDIRDRRIARADPHENKSMRRADIPESALRHPFLHSVGELRSEQQGIGRD
jgi:hypothetical protein